MTPQEEQEHNDHEEIKKELREFINEFDGYEAASMPVCNRMTEERLIKEGSMEFLNGRYELDCFYNPELKIFVTVFDGTTKTFTNYFRLNREAQKLVNTYNLK